MGSNNSKKRKEAEVVRLVRFMGWYKAHERTVESCCKELSEINHKDVTLWYVRAIPHIINTMLRFPNNFVIQSNGLYILNKMFPPLNDTRWYAGHVRSIVWCWLSVNGSGYKIYKIGFRNFWESLKPELTLFLTNISSDI